MPESIQITIGIITVIIVYILTMLGKGWWTRRVCLTIIKDLEAKGAVNAATAVTLPYEKANYFRIGYRDYRPKALESLILGEIVYRTFSGQYYLNQEKLSDFYKQTSA
jgi:hypothetical protein